MFGRRAADHVAVFSTLEFISTTTEELLFAVRFSLFPLSFVGGAGLIFALLYAGFISPKNKLIMLIIMFPLAITYLPALTNDYFYLIIVKKQLRILHIPSGVCFL